MLLRGFVGNHLTSKTNERERERERERESEKMSMLVAQAPSGPFFHNLFGGSSFFLKLTCPQIQGSAMFFYPKGHWSGFGLI